MRLAACLLLVCFFFGVIADEKHFKYSAEDELPEDSLYDQDTERHREKRALFGPEHDYFRQYFIEKGLGNEYMNARNSRGMINNWRSLGVNSYSDAIRQSTNYYSTQAAQGVDVSQQTQRVGQIIDGRVARSQRYGDNDPGHMATTNNWRNGQQNMINSHNDYRTRCGPSNGRKKRGIRFRRFRYGGRGRSSSRSSRRSSRGWFISRRRSNTRRRRRPGC